MAGRWPIGRPCDNPYITVVGGTSLATSGSSWTGNRLERIQNGVDPGLGPALPPAAESTPITPSRPGSREWTCPPTRAPPPCAMFPMLMVADYTYVVAFNGQKLFGFGTSASAPLWAGYISPHQPAGRRPGHPPGSASSIPHFMRSHRDRITMLIFTTLLLPATNTTGADPNQFYARGWLRCCTGWGSPPIQPLIDDLTIGRSVPASRLPGSWPPVSGAGPRFDVTNQDLVIGNTGWLPLNWSLINTSAWFNASVTQGTL